MSYSVILNLVMEFKCENEEKCSEIVTKIFEDFDDQDVPVENIKERSCYIETPFLLDQNDCFKITMMKYSDMEDDYQVAVAPNCFGVYGCISYDGACDLQDIENMKEIMKVIGDKIVEKYGIRYTFVVNGTYG